MDDGRFPNNGDLPLVIIRNPWPDKVPSPQHFETLFSGNHWPAAWRNGLYDFHHYHASAHEVLGMYSGWVTVRFGGPGGLVLEASAGDVIIIPAGVSHCNVGQSADFKVVGAYPAGQRPDMKYGKPGERPAADLTIASVGRPLGDPVFGKDGPLLDLWCGKGHRQTDEP